jgi:hypothetical protein
MVKRIGNVGCQFEVGTPIGITRRNVAKNMIIRLYYCGFQYDRVLKTERYDNKQVVLTLSLMNLYQGVNLEVILIYGNGDISRSSLVFRCSKDNESERRTTTSTIHDTKTFMLKGNIYNYESKSVRQVIVKGDYIVMSRSLHTKIASLTVFLPKTSNPARINWEGILGESQVIRE